jgi:formyltetrahydrofolate-dependent phosphoribosylglycinamide formyltransferase
MTALAEACKTGFVPNSHVVRVIGTFSDSPAIAAAQSLGIDTAVVSTKHPDYDIKLLHTVKNDSPDLICLAGYMRKIPDGLLHAYSGRIMNIHPGLLPKHGGKGMFGQHVHEAVIAGADTESGCTVHFVDEGYDTGPIILQRKVRVMPDDTPEALAARVLEEEHKAYPEAVRLFAEDRLRIDGRVVTVKSESNADQAR